MKLYIYNSSMYSFSINQNRYDFKSFLVVGDLFHFKLFLALLAATSLMKFLFEDDYYHQQQEVFFLSSFLFANLCSLLVLVQSSTSLQGYPRIDESFCCWLDNQRYRSIYFQ